MRIFWAGLFSLNLISTAAAPTPAPDSAALAREQAQQRREEMFKRDREAAAQRKSWSQRSEAASQERQQALQEKRRRDSETNRQAFEKRQAAEAQRVRESQEARDAAREARRVAEDKRTADRLAATEDRRRDDAEMDIFVKQCVPGEFRSRYTPEEPRGRAERGITPSARAHKASLDACYGKWDARKKGM
jgi:membrane protein involved in colicin uptake